MQGRLRKELPLLCYIIAFFAYRTLKMLSSRKKRKKILSIQNYFVPLHLQKNVYHLNCEL